MFNKAKKVTLVCGLVVGLCGAIGTWAEESAAEIFDTLRAKAEAVGPWRADLNVNMYDPETGDIWNEESGVFQTREGAVRWDLTAVQNSGGQEYVYAVRRCLDTWGVSWSEYVSTNFRGEESIGVRRIDTARFPKADQLSGIQSVYGKTAGLRLFYRTQLSTYQALCGNLPELYSMWEDTYTWEVIESEPGTVSVRGSLKEQIREKWAADPMLIEQEKLIKTIELVVDLSTGIPVRIRILDGENRLVSEDMFENCETGIEIDPSVFQFSTSVPDNASIMDMTPSFGESAQAIIDGEYTALVETQRATRKLAIAVGDTLTDFSGPGLDGSTVSLSDYAGKVVLIDYWATWCAPCIAELPNLIAHYEEYRERGFDVLGVSLDNDVELLTDFQEDNPGMSWAQICDEGGWDAELVTRYNVKGVPTTILVDGDGVVLAVNLRGEALSEKLAEIFGTDSTD